MSTIQCSEADLTHDCIWRVGCDGSGEDFYLYSRACFSALTEADAIFCWEIKEGRCKWVKEETERWETQVVSTDFIVHLDSNEGHPYNIGLITYPQSKDGAQKARCDASTVLLYQPVLRRPTG